MSLLSDNKYKKEKLPAMDVTKVTVHAFGGIARECFNDNDKMLPI